MRHRTVRTLAVASLFSAGLVTWSGCNTENADGTPNKLGKMEEKAGEIEHKIGDKAKEVGTVIKDDAKVVGDKIKEEAKVVGDKAKEVGKEIKDEAKVVGEKVKDAVTPEKKP